MAFKTGSRVRETTATTGTGALTLAGAPASFQAFSAVCSNGDLCSYCVTDNATVWEIGIGTWGTGGILTRTAGNVMSGSSGAGVLVTLPAGSKDVFLAPDASDVLTLDNNNNCLLPVSPAVSTPPTGSMGLFVRSVASRLMPAFVGPTGLDAILQPHIGRSRTVRWQPIGNATTVPIVEGILAPTAVGTATARNVATTNVLTRMKRLGYVSAATAGSLCSQYFLAGAQQYTLGNGSGLGGFHMIYRIGVTDAAAVAGARMFCGMRTVVTAPTNVEPSTGQTNSFGFAQLSTDNTQWYFTYGGSAAQTAVALGTAIGAPTLTNTAWDLAIYAPPNSSNIVYYQLTNLGSGTSVSGSVTGVAGTALPANTTFLAPVLWRCNNATALAVGLDISSIYIETDQ